MKTLAFISLLAITTLSLMTSHGYAASEGKSCNSTGTSQVIVFSDVHFNPFYDTTIFPALVAADASQWASIFAASSISEPSTWGEDSNYPLFALALSSMRSNATASSVAIFPGDILVHQFDTRFYALYGSEDETAMKLFLYKTVTFFASEARTCLGSIPVMFALGNNDAYEGDFKIEPNSQFLSDTAEPFYTSFLNSTADHDAFLNTYKAGGYYAARPLGTNLVVITLNSIFFSPDAASNTQTAAAAELDWFESTLASAASSGQKAWLLTHIPPGANIHSNKDRIDARGHLADAKMMWDPDIQTRFLNILSAYSNTVTMIFTGHTHMDEYRLPVCALEVTPSISPIDGNNPAFKVVTYYTGSFEITDYSAIHYDLATMPDSFKNYYTFSSAYETNGILGTMLKSVFPTLRSNVARKATYKGHYYSGHDSASPINDTNWPVYWCGIGKILKQDYIDCVNSFAHKNNDYDGDRKADPVVYDAASGVLTAFLSGSGYVPSSVIMSVQPSAVGVQPIPGDYDGDCLADPAVYLPAVPSAPARNACGIAVAGGQPMQAGDPIANRLLVRYSSHSYSLNTMPSGDASCVPVAGDFDGDGQADPALYSAASGLFAAWLSGSGYAASIIPLGGAGWLNASADYDGDGKTDPAMVETASGAWQVLMSGSAYAPVSLFTAGGVGVVPAPGDYDGDGKADLALFQPATGLWLFALSGQSYAQTPFQGFAGSTFLARPGDYDNDGKTDPAVYAPGLNAYCVWLSGSGYNPAILSW